MEKYEFFLPETFEGNLEVGENLESCRKSWEQWKGLDSRKEEEKCRLVITKIGDDE